MTLRSASWSALALLCVAVSCGDSDDSPKGPPAPVDEAGNGGTGGSVPELGGSGGTGARGGTGNQGGEGGSCEPVECALTCDIADGAPEAGEACTELGNHCEDAVADAGSCGCKTIDYYCCDERWGTKPCERSPGAAGSDAGGAGNAGGAAGAP